MWACDWVYLGLFEGGEVVYVVAVADALGGLFGGEIALGLGHHFEAHEELAHRGGAQQRRVEVDVELGEFVVLAGGQLCRLLVHTHRVGEGALEDIVELARHLRDDARQRHHLHLGHLEHIADLPLCRHHEHLERPHGPVRDDGHKVVVGHDHARLAGRGELELGEREQHRGLAVVVARAEVHPHGGALVLKDLDVLDERVFGGDLLVDLLPALDDGHDVLVWRERRCAELCEREIVLRVEADDVASTARRLRLEQRSTQLRVKGLYLRCGCSVASKAGSSSSESAYEAPLTRPFAWPFVCPFACPLACPFACPLACPLTSPWGRWGRSQDVVRSDKQGWCRSWVRRAGLRRTLGVQSGTFGGGPYAEGCRAAPTQPQSRPGAVVGSSALTLTRLVPGWLDLERALCARPARARDPDFPQPRLGAGQSPNHESRKATRTPDSRPRKYAAAHRTIANFPTDQFRRPANIDIARSPAGSTLDPHSLAVAPALARLGEKSEHLAFEGVPHTALHERIVSEISPLSAQCTGDPSKARRDLAHSSLLLIGWAGRGVSRSPTMRSIMSNVSSSGIRQKGM
ncbi:hypothetical protein L1887_61984 [Cichorium endivia]|nr:hypothetical protein L1887_61984 [Cichorium endivia]